MDFINFLNIVINILDHPSKLISCHMYAAVNGRRILIKIDRKHAVLIVLINDEESIQSCANVVPDCLEKWTEGTGTR